MKAKTEASTRSCDTLPESESLTGIWETFKFFFPAIVFVFAIYTTAIIVALYS